MKLYLWNEFSKIFMILVRKYSIFCRACSWFLYNYFLFWPKVNRFHIDQLKNFDIWSRDIYPFTDEFKIPNHTADFRLLIIDSDLDCELNFINYNKIIQFIQLQICLKFHFDLHKKYLVSFLKWRRFWIIRMLW